jgi:glycosyltransferase involved in cell wall biosynthesis
MVMQFAENFAYKFSDKVVSILPKVAIHVLSHGLSLQKLALIPNGIELSDWGTVKKLPENVSEKFNELRGRGSFIIGYAGAHGIANSLDTLVEAAKYLRTEKVEFVLVGKGPEKDNLQMLAKKYKLNNVHFIDALNKADIPSFLSNCDSLYIGLKRCSLFRFGVSPNKLLDYMMAKKPILYAIDAGNDYVKQASCGVSVEAENPLEIVKGIRKLKSTHPSELNTMGERGQGFLLKNFNYKILANKFIAEIME